MKELQSSMTKKMEKNAFNPFEGALSIFRMKEQPSTMTKKMEKNVTNPFEALSMLRMKLESERFSWAENLCQKWETMCQNSIMVQEPCKIIDEVCEHVRKIYGEVMDDSVNPFSLGCKKAPISDLSLEQADICKGSRTGCDEGSIDEQSLICHMSAFASSLEIASIAPLPDIQQDEMKESCDLFHKKIVSTPPEANICSYSSEIRDDNEEVSKSSIVTGQLGSLPSAAEVSLSEFPEDMIERKFLRLNFTDPNEEDGGSSVSQEVSSSVQSFSTVPEQSSLRSSYHLSEDRTEYSRAVDETIGTNEVDETMGTSEEFEDVSLEESFEDKKLDDCWKEIESKELALISYRAMNNPSYKKKLMGAFTSRFRILKKSNGQRARFHGDIEADLAKMGIMSSSLVSSRTSKASNFSTSESPESDWELL